ncbi:MAG: HNH endonuclease signature motif containing protein [Planctomycetota bacterium]|nr:HNH endonuclease signature motif containing protein [Planctomycetota bacterium]MDA1139121.1 HNH endonuclease signature motif containing protein [Planctomycetota bacterium]
MSSAYIPANVAKLVRQRASNRSEYCLLPQSSQEATFHIDHIRPRADGGQTHPDNLALACVTCSLRKAARVTVRDPKTGRLVVFFNPRTDSWSEHFTWTATWRVNGLTPIGRATARVMGMNRKAIIAIRQQLNALQRFP